MRNTIKYIVSAILIFGIYSSCTNEDLKPYPRMEDNYGAVTLVEMNPDKTYYNAINDIAAEEVEFTLDVNDFGVTDVNSIDVELVFTQKDVLVDLEGNPADSVWATVLLETVTSLPATLNYNGQEIANAIGIDIDDLKVGDNFLLTFPINTADNRRLTVALSSSLCNEPLQPSFGGCSVQWGISCPSAIPTGTWEVYIVASDVTYEVEINASTSAGAYTMPNFNLDYQPGFYLTFDELPISGGFTDVCNTLYLNKVGDHDVQWTSVGVYDPVNQTITFDEISDPAYGQGPWDNSGQSYVLKYVD